MGMIGYFAEIDSEKINQLLESTEKPLMDNICLLYTSDAADD